MGIVSPRWSSTCAAPAFLSSPPAVCVSECVSVCVRESVSMVCLGRV